MIDAQIVPQVIHLLQTAEFDIQKEAAWAISNATNGGSPEQIKYFSALQKLLRSKSKAPVDFSLDDCISSSHITWFKHVLFVSYG